MALNKEEKAEFEELVTAVREKLSPEDFNGLMSGLLEMNEDELEELFKMAAFIEETTNH